MQKLIKIRPKIIKYFFYPKIAVYCNKLFKIILGNILQFTIILVVKIISPLFFVAVLIIYSYQGTGEGEDFAEGDEDRVVDLCQWWAEEAR